MYATCFLDVWAGSCGKSLLTEDRKANLTDPDTVSYTHLDVYKRQDEYCVEVESWPGLAASVRENYDTYLAKGKDNEVDRSNDALFRAQKNTDSIVQDTDAMSVDHEYRLTLLCLLYTSRCV